MVMNMVLMSTYVQSARKMVKAASSGADGRTVLPATASSSLMLAFWASSRDSLPISDESAIGAP